MPTNTKSGREALRLRFSEAAKSITELYRDAVFSYDVGYRDALLLVHRYIVLVAPAAAAAAAANPITTTTSTTTAAAAATATSTATTSSPSFSSLSGQQQLRALFTPSSSSSSSPSPLMDAEGLLRFIQNTLRHRDAMAAASRAMSRRRKRSSSCIERAPYALRQEESLNAGGSATLQDDVHGAPCRRRRRLHPPIHAAGEPNEISTLREVQISRHIEPDSGTDDDDEEDEFAGEM